MKRKAQLASVLSIAALTLPLLFVCIVYACCWCHRWEAERALHVLQTMNPGETTEATFMKQTEPFRTDWTGVTEGNSTSPADGSFEIGNVPLWTFRIPFADWLSPSTTDFVVVPHFRNHRLTGMTITEMQGSGHPFGARIEWEETAANEEPQQSQEPFNGYRVSEWERDMPPWGYIILMDHRATVSERQHALDLNFQCFTRVEPCTDARLFLRPVDNRTQ